MGGMHRSTRYYAFAAAMIGLLVAAPARPIWGQQLRTSLEARTHVFPTIGPGIIALKRDSSGRYYVIARPATIISIYDSNGNLTGQIPNANSQGAIIKYAVDIDLSPDGLLFVADRGANAVEIFKPDGSLVAKAPVNAPTSLVALSNGQFAVTSLTSDRLVQIRDENGKLVRSFGDPSDITDDAEKKSLMEWGKISGDSADDIYFALTSVPDPTLRKYDRYGYAGYETTIPESVIDAASTTLQDRVQLSVNVSHLSLSEQTVGSVTFGSSRDVSFSGGVGTGLLGGMRSGGGFGRAGLQTSLLQSGTGGSPSALFGGGPIGGMISGEISDQGPHVQFGLGSMRGGRGGGQGRAGGGASSASTASDGVVLEFSGSGSGSGIAFTDQDLSQSLTYNAQQAGDAGPFGGATYGGPGAENSAEAAQIFDQGFGLPTDFIVGTLADSLNFRPQGGFGGGMHNGGAGEMHAGPAGAESGAEGPAGALPGGGAAGSGAIAAGGAGSGGAGRGEEHFGPRGRFGGGETGFSASVRVNLGDLSNKLTDKPVITAVGVDSQTHDIWAGIGDTLVHFNKAGDALEIYHLTMRGGAPLKPVAILVEPDRFLIAADPWGIFEFARPDKPVLTAPLQYNGTPPTARPQP
jgi:hypothetical protein